MIVVFDSGIWVSAMEFGGTLLEAVIGAIAQDRFAVYDQTEKEVVRVLTRKFGWEAERIRADLGLYWLDALRVKLEGTITGICRDPKDEPILEWPNARRPSASSPATTTCCHSFPTVRSAS